MLRALLDLRPAAVAVNGCPQFLQVFFIVLQSPLGSRRGLLCGRTPQPLFQCAMRKPPLVVDLPFRNQEMLRKPADIVLRQPQCGNFLNCQNVRESPCRCHAFHLALVACRQSCVVAATPYSSVAGQIGRILWVDFVRPLSCLGQVRSKRFTRIHTDRPGGTRGPAAGSSSNSGSSWNDPVILSIQP